MSVTERTTTSWLSRIRNALVGIVVGIVCVIGSIWLLVWNEGRAVQTYRALAEGAGIVVSVAPDAIDPAQEGKLVHVSGAVTADTVPVDTLTGVSAEGAVAVNRTVEMYQWVEHSESKTEKSLGGSEETVTTYTYSKEWSDRPVDSSKFKQPEGHENPAFPIESESFVTAGGAVGAFHVAGDKLAWIGARESLPLDAEKAGEVAAVLSLDRPVDAAAGKIFAGDNRNAPAVGDLTIAYERVDLKQASFVARQFGGELADYTASNGRTIFLAESGLVPASEMFAHAQSENTIITWILRIVGLVVMFVGFSLMFAILGVLADVVPFIGSIVSFGTGFIAFLLTAVIGPLMIALGWFAYRPLLSVAIIAVGVALAAGIVYLRRRSAAVPAAAAKA